MKKTGIFGGTFDPVHLGHMLLAETAFRQYGLDEVLFMPNYRAPHKDPSHVTDDEYRTDMLEAAVKDIPYMGICTLELEKQGISYTAETVTLLKEERPDDKIYFIIGEDSLIHFKTWYHPEIILQKVSLLVAGRITEGDPVGNLQEHIDEITGLYGGEIGVLSMPFLDISSSLIRERVKNRESIRFLVPEAVRVFIEEHGLYTDLS